LVHSSRPRRALALSALLGCATIAPLGAHAQARRSDYLLGRPKATFTLRVGAGRPNASNGVFAVTDSVGKKLLTLSPDQFVGANFGADLGVPFTQKLELQLSFSSSSRQAESEYRDFVDNRDLPIEQATRLQRVPISLGLRYNLVPAGRSISRLAWVPNRIVPYVAAGAGTMYYRFRQNGDFVDFRSRSLDVFTARLEAKGWAPLGYAAGGLTWSVLPAVALNTEVRYDHASTPMRGDFTGFGRTSLSGVAINTGLQFRF
jgi:opacity protein-like surface antigen